MLPSPQPAVVFQRLEDGAVLYLPTTEIYFGLNEVGAHVWELLPPATRTLDELCARLARSYPDVDAREIHADTTELLERLAAEGLVVPGAAGAGDGEPPR